MTYGSVSASSTASTGANGIECSAHSAAHSSVVRCGASSPISAYSSGWCAAIAGEVANRSSAARSSRPAAAKKSAMLRGV